MQNSLGLSIAVALIYTLICFFDMRFIKRESIPFKVQFRNSAFVLISTLLGTQLLKSIGDSSAEEVSGSTSAFTGPPGF
jgi:hypothetical protein